MKQSGPRNITGERIRQFRKAHVPPLTQTDLARCLNRKKVPMRRDYISRIENGELGVSDIEIAAFAKCLGVSISSLFGERQSKR